MFKLLEKYLNKQEDNDDMLTFVKLSSRAFEPSAATPGSVGLDLKSVENITIEPQSVERINLDLAIASFPKNCYGRIASRSNMVLKGIDVKAGVIDRDFTGHLQVILENRTLDQYHVCRGDKVAQLICEQCVIPQVKEVKSLPLTSRGSNGFGSSGI